MRKLLIIFCLALSGVPAQASIEAYEFDSAQIEADYNRLINELRCLVCQNQNLAGSDAELAQDLRRQTYEMLQRGESPQDVIDFMVERYGDFVLYRPQFKPTTWLLWLGPFVLLLIVLVMLVRRLRIADDAPRVGNEALDEARRLLESDEPKQ